MLALDALIFIDAHPVLRTSINVSCLTVTALLSVAPLFRQVTPPWLRFFKQPWLFFLLMALSLFFCRYPAFFFPQKLNPDEAQMLAQAITYETHPIPWRDVDGTTSGPLNSYALLVSLLLGIQPDYFTARFLALACILGMFIFLYLATRRLAGDLAARIALLPFVLFIALNVQKDFLHYSSETISVFILGWAIYLMTRLARQPGTVATTVLLGLLLGLLPFAKLQTVPLGAFLGLTAIWFLFTSHHLRRKVAITRIFALIASAALPALVILSIVAHVGAFNDFKISYLDNAAAYVSQNDSLLHGLKRRVIALFWLLTPAGELAIPFNLALISIMIIGLGFLFGFQEATRSCRKWFLWAILFMLVSITTIAFSGKLFPHYEFLLLPALIFLTAISFRMVMLGRYRPDTFNALTPLLLATILDFPAIPAYFIGLYAVTRLSRIAGPWFLWLSFTCLALSLGWRIVRARWIRQGQSSPPISHNLHGQKYLPLACLVPFFILPALALASLPNPYRGSVQAYLKHSMSPIERAIRQELPPGGRMAIWGWAAEYAVETQTTLGTRDSISEFATFPNPLQSYYRARYLRDLKANRPELFLEDSHPLNFLDTRSTNYGIVTYPELAKYISDEYTLKKEINGMRLFVRRDLVKAESDSSLKMNP
jgi:hypothetical protein